MAVLNLVKRLIKGSPLTYVEGDKNLTDIENELNTPNDGKTYGRKNSNLEQLSDIATSGDYNDLTNTPTNVSDFINDSGFITVGVIPSPQTLAISGNDLSISGGNTVVLPPDTTQVSVSKNGTLVGITDKLNFVAGTNTTVDVDNILGVYRIKFNNSSLQSLQAGAGIGIDITNPLSPIVYALQKMQIALTDRSNNIVASTIVHEFIVLENFEITSSPFISLVTAPTGANFILQIQKNGVEVGINTKALVVTAGTNVSTATTDFNGVTFAKGDRISFRVTQIGSVNAGKGLDILLNFKN
jgi:hypothetical protein